MGLPIFGFLALTQTTEDNVVPKIQPRVWIRNADGTFFIIKSSDSEKSQTIITNIFDGIRFTMEIENDNKLPFLAMPIRRTVHGTLGKPVYCRRTHTNRIQSFHSNHTTVHKVSSVRTLFNKAKTNSSKIKLQKMKENHLFEMFRQTATEEASSEES